MPTKRNGTPADDLFSAETFQWEVAEDGYAWASREVAIEPYFDEFRRLRVLAPKAKAGESRARRYRPLEVPELFRVFAMLPIGEGPIREFADRFGLLGLGTMRLEQHAADHHPTPVAFAEDLDEWTEQIVHMLRVLLVWDALTSARLGPLSAVVAQVQECEPRDDGAFRNLPLRAWVIAETEDGIRVVGDWYPTYPTSDEVADRRAAAWVILNRVTNERLRAHCSPYLDQRSDRPEIQTVRVGPNNLLGALWWQFARTIIGEASYRQCKVCSRVIELSTGTFGFRADREFCSPACKARDHRAKVRKVKQMKAKGKSVPQIAKHFDTSNETIKNWLAKKK